jgi:glutathione S-transferase
MGLVMGKGSFSRYSGLNQSPLAHFLFNSFLLASQFCTRKQARMENNITLYSLNGTPNCIKVTLALEELNLKYATQTIDLRKNEQKNPWFLEINPNGRIPALKDGDLRIFESGAILLYLADKYDTDHKIAYPHGTNEYYEMLSWVMFQMGGVGPMQGILSNSKPHFMPSI